MDGSDLLREVSQDLVRGVRAGRLTRRELFRRATVLGVPLVAASGLLSACGGPPTAGSNPSSANRSATSKPAGSGSPTRGGTLRVALGSPTSAIDPITMYDSASIVTVEQIAEYLIRADNHLNLNPVLATRWSPQDSAKRWTFQLRGGVRFHDGSPLSAADVVASFERLVNPTSNSAALSTFQGVLSSGNIEAQGSGTVVFHLDRAFAEFPYLVASTNYNTVILPKSYHGDFEKHPVGTGPFQLSSYTPKQRATFTRNRHYWRTGRPYLDGVELHYLPDTQSQVLQMQGGNVDVMSLVSLQSARPLFNSPKFRILTARTSQYREVHMRVDKAPFTDQRVRQALALCVDRSKVIQSLFSGGADIGNDEVFAPVFPDAPTLPQRHQDYAKARSLLADAGHGSGMDITLSLEKTGEIPDYAVLLQQMFKPAGVRVKLDQMSQQAYYGSGNNQPWLEVPMGIIDWGARAIPAQLFSSAYTCHGAWNSSKWCDPQFDAVAKQFEATVESSERSKLATQLATMQHDATPAIISYWMHSSRAVTPNVHGVQPNGTGMMDLTSAYLAG